MKKLLVIITILCLPMLAIAQDDCTYKIADDESFKTALHDFHEVMAELWHGPAQEGKIEPVAAKMDALKSLRNGVLKANLHSEFAFRCAEVSAAAAAFSKAVDGVAATLDSGDGTKVKEAFSVMHDRYRDLRMLTVSVSAYAEKFHDVMHPLWHEAYEAKDIEAIRAGVAELELYAERILKANTGKPGDAEAHAKALVKAVAELKKCCAEDSDEAILEALKLLHDAYHALVD